MRPVHNITTSIETTHGDAFTLLAQYMDPLLTSGRALTIHSSLDKFKPFLEDQDYELYDSYTAHKVKSRILMHCGSKVAITEEHHQSQSVYSSQISIADAINTAARYKEILKNNELIDCPEISYKNYLIVLLKS